MKFIPEHRWLFEVLIEAEMREFVFSFSKSINNSRNQLNIVNNIKRALDFFEVSGDYKPVAYQLFTPIYDGRAFVNLLADGEDGVWAAKCLLNYQFKD